MCTVNMTFEVPESKSIDIEALKKQMYGFFNLLISRPSIVKEDVDTSMMVAEEEEGWEASPELLDRLEKARQEVREGNCVTLQTKDDINAYFDSL